MVYSKLKLKSRRYFPSQTITSHITWRRTFATYYKNVDPETKINVQFFRSAMPLNSCSNKHSILLNRWQKKITAYSKNRIRTSLDKQTLAARSDLGIVRFVRRGSTWLQHLLHQVEADARFALVLGHGEIVEQVKMSHVRAVRVPVLVDQPFPLAGVGVPRADVLGLKMLQLAVDVVSVRHSRLDEGSWNSRRRGGENHLFIEWLYR